MDLICLRCRHFHRCIRDIDLNVSVCRVLYNGVLHRDSCGLPLGYQRERERVARESCERELRERVARERDGRNLQETVARESESSHLYTSPSLQKKKKNSMLPLDR